MNLDRWFNLRIHRPVLLLFLVVSFSYIALIGVLYVKNYSDNDFFLEPASENLILAINQKDRPQIETIITSLKKLNNVKEVVLCKDNKSLVGSTAKNACLKSNEEAKYVYIPGNEKIFLKIIFKNFLFSEYALAAILLLLGSLLFTVIFINKFKVSLETDLIIPIKNLNNSSSSNVINELDQIAKDLIDAQVLKIKNEKQKILNDISKQVSHDIRSPLMALNVLIDSQKNIDKNDLKFIKKSIERINEIANGLLSDNRSRAENVNKNKEIVLGPFLNDLISEKKFEFKEYDLINIGFRISENAFRTSVFIDQVEISRVISNLINNSIEAMNFMGNVNVEASLDEAAIIIKIEDNGGGIPEAIISKLGSQEISSKKTGNGLGIFHAFKIIKEIGGDITFKNSNSGLIVRIAIPIIRSLSNENIDAVLVDDDDLCRMIWEKRAKNKGLNIVTCSTKAQFVEVKKNLPKNTAIYLDSDLGNGIKGEDLAIGLYSEGYSNLFMTTGYREEQFKDSHFLKGVISKAPPF